jgi:hypothetical protein
MMMMMRTRIEWERMACGRDSRFSWHCDTPERMYESCIERDWVYCVQGI